MMTNENYSADLANIPDKKLLFDFAKEMCSDEKALRHKSNREKSLISLLQSPAILAGSLKNKFFSKPIETKTAYLSSSPNKLCD